MSHALQCRNVTVNGRRTSMRLEPMLWTLLDDIAGRERLPINVLVSRIEQAVQREANGEVNLTGAVRLFVMQYFRAAATEEGHERAGHGLGEPFKGLHQVTRDTSPPRRRERGRPRNAGLSATT